MKAFSRTTLTFIKVYSQERLLLIRRWNDGIEAALPVWINTEQKWKWKRLQMKKTNEEFIRFDKLEMSWREEMDSVWNSLGILFQQTIGEGDYTVEWPPKSKELGNTGATEIKSVNTNCGYEEWLLYPVH